MNAADDNSRFQVTHNSCYAGDVVQVVAIIESEQAVDKLIETLKAVAALLPPENFTPAACEAEATCLIQ